MVDYSSLGYNEYLQANDSILLTRSELLTGDLFDLQTDRNIITATKIGSDVIGAGIADLSITSAKLASAAVITSKLAASAVTTDALTDLAVTAAKLAGSAVTTEKIIGSAITTAKISDDAITAAKLIGSAVTTDKLDDEAITAAKIGGSVIGGTHIATAAIGSAQIGTAAIWTAHIGTAAVGSAQISAAAIGSLHVQDVAIGSAKIGALAVYSAHIASAAIGSAQIGTGVIAQAHIGTGQITNALLATASIGEANIQNAAITSAKIGSAAVGAAAIAAAAIGSAAIGSAAIQSVHIGSAAVLDAAIGNISWNKGTGGTLVLGGTNNVSGQFELRDAGGTAKVTMDKDGIIVNDGKITIKNTGASDVIDAYGVVSTTNFPYIGTVDTSARTGTNTTFATIANTTISFSLDRTSYVLFLMNGNIKQDTYGTVRLHTYMGLGIDGTLFPDSTGGFGLVRLYDFRSGTGNAAYHGFFSAHHVESLGAGGHTASLQWKGILASPAVGTPAMAIDNSELTAIKLGT